jgi:hypothetical protein
MLLIILCLIIYFYFFSNNKSTILKDKKILAKIDHFLKPHLNKITHYRDKIYNSKNIKEEKMMLADIYQDKITELENAISSILLIFPKRYEKKINNYIMLILDEYKLE